MSQPALYGNSRAIGDRASHLPFGAKSWNNLLLSLEANMFLLVGDTDVLLEAEILGTLGDDTLRVLADYEH